MYLLKFTSEKWRLIHLQTTTTSACKELKALIHARNPSILHLRLYLLRYMHEF
jgi:hypothetical protein